MAKPWDSSLVREMLTRAESENAAAGGRSAYRPEGLNPAFGMQADGCTRCPTRRPRKSCRCVCSA